MSESSSSSSYSDDVDSQAEYASSSQALISNIVQGLFSYNVSERTRIFEYYFMKDAEYTCPLLSVRGSQNILNLHETWSGMNRTEPTVTNIVFNGRTAVVQHVQNVSPFVLPACCTFRLPVVTTLYFKEQKDSGISKIYKQIDSWTLDGLLEAMPIVSFWYSRVFRFVVGKLASVAADAIQRPAHSSIGTGPWQQVQLIDEKFDDDPRPWLQHEQNDLCDGMILLEDE